MKSWGLVLWVCIALWAAVLTAPNVAHAQWQGGGGGGTSIPGNTLPTHNFATSISSSGAISGAQPSAADIAAGTFVGGFTFSTAPVMSGANISSGSIPTAALAVDPTNASNISSGSLATARGGTGSTLGAAPPTGTGTLGDVTPGGNGTFGQFTVNSVVNVQAPKYGASGSANTYTCSITSGQSTLSCTATTDFAVGQYLGIPTAGQAAQVPIAVTGTVTNTAGTATGTTNDCYEIVSADADGGLNAPSAATCNATGPAATAFSTASALNVAFSGGNSNAVFGIYRSINGGAYTFVNTTTGSPYKDFGEDLPQTWDWPATPAARNETAYCKVTAVSTVTHPNDTVTVDCTSSQGTTTAPNTATSVTVRHDDTIAVQAALDDGAGKEVFFPTGTYRFNEIAYISPTPTIAYNPNTGNPNEGALWLRVSKARLVGAGRGKTILRQDFASLSNVRGGLLMMTSPNIQPLNGPQIGTSGGPARYTSYPINNATKYSQQVVTTTTANASNFNPGDIVFITGGQAVDGFYSISNLSRVIAVNPPTQAAGTIVIADPLTSDLPFGTPGTSNFIEDLTTNNASLDNIAVEDMTLSTPNTDFSFNSIYGLTFQRLSIPEVETYGAAFTYGQTVANMRISDSDINTASWQDTVNSYVTIQNTKFRSLAPLLPFTLAGGATSPVIMTNSDLNMYCGGFLQLGVLSPDVTVSNNQIREWCPIGSSALDAPTVTYANATAGAGNSYNWLFNNNTVYSQAVKLMAANNLANPIAPNTMITENALYHQKAATVTTFTVDLDGSFSFNNNRIYTTAPSNTGQTVIVYRPTTTAGNQQTHFMGNVITQSGTDNEGCFNVVNPGSVASGIIDFIGNRCIGYGSAMGSGLLVGNTTNTPNIMLSGNIFENVTSPYSPATLRNAEDCPHFLTPPTTGAGSITAGGSDCVFENTGATTATTTVTFGTAWKAKPLCACQDETTAAALKNVTGTTTCAVSTLTANDSFVCHCLGGE